MFGVAIITHGFALPIPAAMSSPFDDPFSSASKPSAPGADLCLGLEMARREDGRLLERVSIGRGEGKVEIAPQGDLRVYLDQRCPATVAWFQEQFCTEQARRGNRGWKMRLGAEEVLLHAEYPDATAINTEIKLVVAKVSEPKGPRKPRPDDPAPRGRNGPKRRRVAETDTEDEDDEMGRRREGSPTPSVASVGRSTSFVKIEEVEEEERGDVVGQKVAVTKQSEVETKNKASLKKLVLARIVDRGVGRDSEIFKDLFGIVNKGVSFALRDTFKTTTLDKDKAILCIDKHLEIYLPPRDVDGDVEMGKPEHEGEEPGGASLPSPKSLGAGEGEADGVLEKSPSSTFPSRAMTQINGSSSTAPPAQAGPDSAIAKIATDVVMLDNYDSFTWNLYQYLCLLGAKVTVIRSEAITLDELAAQHPNLTHLVISPGPGHPLKDSGISMDAIKAYAGKIPILGICMGLQCMYATYGGVVDKAGEVVHGKTSAVLHDGKGLFKGVSQGVQSTRYHSLAARLNTLPDELEITSRTESGVVMGLRHREFALEGLQYHPESILSEEGRIMFSNFLTLTSGLWKENAGFELAGTPIAAVAPSDKSTALPVPAPAAVPTILQKIEQQRWIDVAKSKATPGFTPADLSSLISLHVPPPLISFHRRLQPSAPLAADERHMALLAEVKRASPSKGDLVDGSSPSAPSIALSYALAGASVISVLTEPKWFKGSLADMRAVRAAVDALPNRPAILRKDFILDPYQIDEARVYGADTVLLIVAMLTEEKLAELYNYALSRGMEPLVEVNNAEELDKALKVGAKVIGVNNRNLHDFNVDMGTTSRMADVIKEKYGEKASDVVLIALSGIVGRADVERYASQGVGAVLVGESLMRAKDKGAFVRELLGVKAPAVEATSSQTLVKICGLKTPEAALAATEAGADFLGLILVPGSKRFVSTDEAKAIISAVRSHSSSVTRPPPAPLDTSDWFSLQTSRLAANPQRPLIVGVFQNPTLEQLIATVDELKLDVVQLHGDEPIGWSRLLGVPVIKAFHVDSNVELEDAATLNDATRPGFHSVSLLDTKVSSGKGALSGGAGKVFDWGVAQRLVESRGEGRSRLPIILAGGLDAENVVSGIEQVKPWAVDVSGGVETNGAKDVEKIAAFIKLVKQQ
ncbi:anthranilate synthase [Pseudohyphozyma bogoriensis]|nr:anthranilate synthase [Pseudohyphozyma bogoriensis]